MSETARALWYVGPGRAEICEHPLDPPGAGEVRVRARFGAVSRGTESLFFYRRVPASEVERMRAPFQYGELPGAVSHGYMTVGSIETGPRAGETVFALHPHHTRFVVPDGAALSVPEGVPAERAVLAANMETALNVIWDAELRADQRVQVVGAGVVGCLVARLAAKRVGAKVELVDVEPARASSAEALGVSFATPDRAAGERDVIVECSGAPVALTPCLGRLSDEGTVVVASWYGDGEARLPLGADFHARRLRIVSSQVGRVAPAMRGRYSPRARLELALELLDDPAVDVLFGEDVPFGDLPARLPDLFGRGGGSCTRIIYPDGSP